MPNLRLALRTLFKTPFVTTIAVLSLALGIGANTAIFSLFDEVLRRPLPVSHPERLVNLSSTGPQNRFQNCNQAGPCEATFSYPMFKDLERANTAFVGIAGHHLMEASIASHNQTLNGHAMLVSGSYFPLLGIQPALGRLLTPQDDQDVGANSAVVLGYGYWQTKLGADSSVVGRQVIVNGQSFTVLGVAPRDFNGTTPGTMPDVYVPFTMAASIGFGDAQYTDRRDAWIYLFARLKPGASIAGAERAVNAVYHPIVADVEAPLQEGVSPQTMAQFKAKQVRLEDGRRGQSNLQSVARTPLLLLFATTGIVLLIACANIANLLLVRGANRRLEMTVRLSLGATRKQLVSQLLTESVLLAAIGGTISFLVATTTLGAFRAFVPPESKWSLPFALNGGALRFAAGLSIATGFVFGLFPALQSTRSELITGIRAGTGKHSGTRAASRFRNGLVTVQIALSMTLLFVAGLFLESLRNVTRVDLGVKVDHVVTFAVAPERNGYSPRRSRTLFDRLDQSLFGLPGVTGVTTASVPLVGDFNRSRPVAVEGFTNTTDTDVISKYNRVGPRFFKVLGMTILAGRDFTLSDESGTQKVAIVNETFAKKFGLGRGAVGKFMSMRMGDTSELLIVGLARDAKYSEVKDQVPPVFFLAQRQDTTLGSTYFYVRTSDDPVRLFPTVRSVVAQLDPNLPVQDLKTLPQQVKENVFLDRTIGVLSTSFAALATLLAAIGLYGVLAYSIAQRTREIGVRIALGADPLRVQSMVLRQVGTMTLIGGLVGVGGAVALGRVAQSLLFEIKGYDPLVMAASAAALAVVALGAGYIPALRASKVDPVSALRCE
jgi:putative ABC transport system permease protein